MDDAASSNLLFRFLKLANLNILSTISVPIAGLVDTAFLGHLSDISHLAGVAIASVIVTFIYGTCEFLRMGTTGPTAQADGSADETEVLLVLLRSSFIALIVGLLLILFQYPLQDLGFSLLHSAPEVKIAGRDYFSARILGAPAVFLNFCLIGWLLGRGKSLVVLILFLLGCVSNIALDYWFVSHLNWASAGVGAATAISQYLMFLSGLIYILSEGLLPRFWAVIDQAFDREKMLKMLQFNGDITLRIVATRLTLIVFTDLSASLGTDIVAINSLLFQVMVITSLLSEGLSYATETLAGNFLGQNLTQKLPWLLQISGTTSICLGIGAVTPFILFPSSLFGLLTDHLEILDEMGFYILWLVPFTISNSLFNILRGYWLGLTRSNVLRNSTIVGSVVGFIPLTFIAMQLQSSHILWFALCMFSTISVFIMSREISLSKATCP